MTFLKAFFLAALQGLTEFLPVSSSGHLVLAQRAMHLGNTPILFDLALHVGTVLAVIIFYWEIIVLILKDICRYLILLIPKNGRKESRIEERKAILQSGNIKLFAFILISTAVTGIFGVIFSDYITGFFYKTEMVSIFLITTGIILLMTIFAEERGIDVRRKGYAFPVIIGISQSFAMLPGISRSGTTISTALFLGVKREMAGEYSFLISIPSILGATVYELLKMPGEETMRIDFLYYIFAFAVSFIFGWLALKLLVSFLKQGKVYIFSIYCIFLGVISLFLLK